MSEAGKGTYRSHIGRDFFGRIEMLSCCREALRVFSEKIWQLKDFCAVVQSEFAEFSLPFMPITIYPYLTASFNSSIIPKANTRDSNY
jgi:hypothetical protein